jgi:hypothetical protein
MGLGGRVGVLVAAPVNSLGHICASHHCAATSTKEADHNTPHQSECKPHTVLFEKPISTAIMPCLSIKKGRRKPSFLGASVKAHSE